MAAVTSLKKTVQCTYLRHQQGLQLCENNEVRRIAGVKRVDRRRMDELREEIGVQMSLTGRFVRR